MLTAKSPRKKTGALDKLYRSCSSSFTVWDEYLCNKAWRGLWLS